MNEQVQEDAIFIRRAGPGDVATVLGLLREHYGPNYDTAARHEWLYRRNPHGIAVTWLAFDRRSGEPAGLTSMFPRRLSVGGKEFVGAIGGDGFVRPRFRRRGIATLLHRASLCEMTAVGIDVMYGPPEPHNLAALVRAGAVVVCQLRRFVRPLDPVRLAPWGESLSPLRRWLRPRRSPLRIRALAPADFREVEKIWESSVNDLAVAPVRDAAYYAWRFGNFPGGKQRAFLILDGGHPIGICAIERNGLRSALVDLVTPKRRYEATIDAISSFCRDDAAIEARLNERGPIAPLLWRRGFVPRDRKPFQVLVNDEHPRAESLRRADAWYYTTGDGDVEAVL